MKKIIILLALALMLLPGLLLAVCPTPAGDPGIYRGWGWYTFWPQPPNQRSAGVRSTTVTPGQLFSDYVAPLASGTPFTFCSTGDDTFCCTVVDKRGWTISVAGSAPVLGSPIVMSPATYYQQSVTVKTPCSAVIGAKDTVIASFHYYRGNKCTSYAECPDCLDPNTYAGRTYYDADTLVLTVVVAPPALSVFQDTLTLVERGQSQAFVPFQICNSDPCAGLNTYGYHLTSKGHVGPAINVTGTVDAAGGVCKDVFGVIDASGATTCQFDTLKIIAWTTSGTIVYDTCVQRIHVIDPQPVPLFSVPVVTILVLALILAAAVFMRRRAVSRA